MTITYARPVEARHSAPPLSQRTVSGYGSRIPIDMMVRLEGERIWRRVYAICWSNAASFYVRSKGRRLFLRDSELDLLRESWLVCNSGSEAAR